MSLAFEHHLSACEQRHRSILQLIGERARQPSAASRAFVSLTQDIQTSLSQFDQEIHALHALLEGVHARGLTQGELGRRKRLVETLQAREKTLKQLFRRGGAGGAAGGGGFAGATATSERERQQLLRPAEGGGLADLGAVGWHQFDDEDVEAAAAAAANPSANRQLKLRQEEVLQEQDRGLDTLADVIGRQKRLAASIGHEAGAQNDLIDDLGQGMDQATQRLIDTTQNIRVVDRKDRTCGYWLVIVGLLIAIVVVALLPGGKK